MTKKILWAIIYFILAVGLLFFGVTIFAYAIYDLFTTGINYLEWYAWLVVVAVISLGVTLTVKCVRTVIEITQGEYDEK